MIDLTFEEELNERMLEDQIGKYWEQYGSAPDLIEVTPQQMYKIAGFSTTRRSVIGKDAGVTVYDSNYGSSRIVIKRGLKEESELKRMLKELL